MLPCASSVGRFVYAVADGEIRATQPFAAAHINNVWIGRRNRQRSDRTRGLVVEGRVPSASVVSRLPHAAIVGRHIEDIRLAGNSGNSHCPSGSEWADHAPVQFLVKCRVDLLGGKRNGKKQKAKGGERNPGELLVHSWSSEKARINQGRSN